MNAQIVSSVIGAVATALLAVIGRAVIGMRNDVRLFMREHMWLLATGLWTRDNVIEIMKSLGMEINNLPPSDLPTRK